jgi:hypothetical protein
MELKLNSNSERKYRMKMMILIKKIKHENRVRSTLSQGLGILSLLILSWLLSFEGSAKNRSPGHASSLDSSVVKKAKRMIDEAMVKTPQDQEICFSPAELCDVKLIKLVQSAQKSIDLAIYDINLDQLVHEILLQSKKIPVRLIVDRRQAQGNHSLVPLLKKAGTNIRYGHQRGIFHNKFTIVDHKMIETGSFNYTHHAATANHENQIYLANPKIVETYQKHFDDLWAQADEFTN